MNYRDAVKSAAPILTPRPVAAGFWLISGGPPSLFRFR